MKNSLIFFIMYPGYKTSQLYLKKELNNLINNSKVFLDTARNHN